MSGPWLDLTLLALLVATVAALFWLRLVRVPFAGGAGEDGGTRRLGFATVTRQAGFEPRRVRWLYWPAKLGLAFVLGYLYLELLRPGGPSPGWAVVPALVGFLLPDLVLRLLRRRRRRRVEQGLSFFLDLLVSLLYSGLSLEQAFRRAGREGLPRSHPLAREVRRVGLELEAGRDRSDAFRSLAERTGVRELKAVAAALRLSLRHGTSAETALETQAEMLRTKRRENARREIAAAATKAVPPILLCGFPVFLVIVFFPAILELIETFRAFVSLF